MSITVEHITGTGETHRFLGRPKVFFLAFCGNCWPDRWAPMPFATERERDEWAHQHASAPMPLSGDYHKVELSVEVRC